jgi:hypothetical protein
MFGVCKPEMIKYFALFVVDTTCLLFLILTPLLSNHLFSSSSSFLSRFFGHTYATVPLYCAFVSLLWARHVGAP